MDINKKEAAIKTAKRMSNIYLIMLHWCLIVPSKIDATFQCIHDAGFPIQWSRVQNHWVAQRSTQPFILPRSIKWVPGISGNLVVKSQLPSWSGSSLEAVEPHPKKGAINFFFFLKGKSLRYCILKNTWSKRSSLKLTYFK